MIIENINAPSLAILHFHPLIKMCVSVHYLRGYVHKHSLLYMHICTTHTHILIRG